MPSRHLDAAPPEAFFVVAAVSQYIGAAIAVWLFDRLDPAAVALFRVIAASLAILAWRRPWRRRWTRVELAWASAFGIVLAFMNLCFYLALDSLHLGTAVAIEFLGPIAVAAALLRSRRNAGALVLAVAGVALLSEVSTTADANSVGWALAAAALWAAYIVLAERVAHEGAAVDGLGIGMAVGAVALAPIGLVDADPVLDNVWLLAACAAVGVLSNSVPYALDLVVLQRIPAGRFALLLALLPVTAVLTGLVALGQVPSWGEVAGIALVVLGIGLRDRTGEIGSVGP